MTNSISTTPESISIANKKSKRNPTMSSNAQAATDAGTSGSSVPMDTTDAEVLDDPNMDEDEDDIDVDVDEDEDEDESDEDEEDSDDEEEEDYDHAGHKSEGNDAYRLKDYRTAIAHYTLAIEAASAQLEATAARTPPPSLAATKELQQTLASYYTNRAAGFSMLLQYPEAVRDCDAALAADPAWGKAHVRKAKAYTALGKIDEAIKSYSLGMVRDPNDASLVKEKDDLVKLKRRYDLAEGLLTKLRGSGSANGACPSVSSMKRDARQALAQIDVVIATCPNWNAALLLKIEALVHLSRSSEAYALTTTLVRRTSGAGGSGGEGTSPLDESQSSRLLVLRAKCLFDMGNLDDAAKHLRQILGGDPDNKTAMAFLKVLRSLGKKKTEADGKFRSKQFEEATASYTEALELCPTDSGREYRAKLYFNRASANANLRKHEQVVSDCASAIALDDEYSKAYMRRAASNLVIGGKPECESAIRDYEKASELAKSDEAGQDIEHKLQSARVQLKRASRKDFYKIIGVPRDATDAELKKAYRKLALKWHPDRHGKSSEAEKAQAEEKFREVNLAYEVLSDSVKKQRYDDGVEEQDLDNPHATAPGHGHGHHGFGGGMGGIDPNVMFEMFCQQQGGGRGGGGFNFG